MNLILLFKTDFIDEKKVRLTDRRAEHIRLIHKPEVGDQLQVGLLDGKIGIGVVSLVSEAQVEMEVQFERAPPLALPVTLLVAMHRPIVLKRVLYTATMMGVKNIIVFHSFRVEKSFWNSSLLKNEEWREHLLLGLEQAGDTILPKVTFRKRFKPFLEDEVPEMVKGTTALVAHPGGALLNKIAVNAPVILAVGPEGGFIDYEIEMFKKAGFTLVGLGERILRVETAVTALLAKLF
ncbi:MAG: 16S rRNA (uracil(1498)-N(3))-methyltransferase [Candidatus Omnitrophica bacterium]|nr:16S rRNA (uracil(1498)-N(3))-methyltransferase [Candidatus Omnitrophota bacterium]